MSRSDPEARKRHSRPLDHDPDRRPAELVRIHRRAPDLGGKRRDVVTPIAILGDLATRGQCRDRLAQLADLGTGVVDVELARNRVTVLRQQPR